MIPGGICIPQVCAARLFLGKMFVLRFHLARRYDRMRTDNHVRYEGWQP